MAAKFAKLSVVGEFLDTGISVGATNAQWNPQVSFTLALANGTTVSTADSYYATRATANASAATYDLTALSGELADSNPVSMAGGVAFFIVTNRSSTSGETLAVGAGSNPFVGWVEATGDAVTVHPGGCLVWCAGDVDDVAPVASTGDILTLDPGAATIIHDLMVVGRSA